MARGKIYIKFPCGYEYLIEGRGFDLEIDNDGKGFPVCPLHGKNCSKHIQ